MDKTSGIPASICVFGDGWSATLAVASILAQSQGAGSNLQDKKIIWARGNRACPLPVEGVFPNESAANLAELLDQKLFGDEWNTEPGQFDRFYKNKSFRTMTTEVASDFWQPEQRMIFGDGFRFTEKPFLEWWKNLRNHLIENPNIIHIVDSELIEFEVMADGGQALFAKGEKVSFEKFIFADRLADIRKFPKLFRALQGQIPTHKTSDFVGLLQCTVTHSVPVEEPLDVRFILPMTRDAGEDFERHAFGVFTSPETSVWNILLHGDDAEDNHMITKRMRKMKNAISKCFEHQPGLQKFSQEIVRYEPNMLLNRDVPKQQIFNSDLMWLTDAFGFGFAADQILNSWVGQLYSDASQVEDVPTLQA